MLKSGEFQGRGLLSSEEYLFAFIWGFFGSRKFSLQYIFKVILQVS
jgi:hypothetical protein